MRYETQVVVAIIGIALVGAVLAGVLGGCTTIQYPDRTETRVDIEALQTALVMAQQGLALYIDVQRAQGLLEAEETQREIAARQQAIDGYIERIVRLVEAVDRRSGTVSVSGG